MSTRERSVETEQFTSAGCHVYAGGFSEGCRRAGFRVSFHAETGLFGTECFAANFPESDVFVGTDSWPNQRVDLLVANPPCAPFSNLGSGKRLSDPRLACWAEAVAALVKFEPAVFVGESVQGMYTNGFPFVAEIAQACVALGYEVHFVLHDAKFLGLPQQRRRFFLAASKYRMEWPAPRWTRVTVREALSGLDDPGPVVSKMKPEYVALWGLGGSMWGTCKAFGRSWKEAGLRTPRLGTRRISWDETVGTVYGATLCHPDEPRFLGVREYARLMGFPDSWIFAGPEKPLSLMTKGVTPNCGEYAAKVAAESLRCKLPARSECFERTICASTQLKNDWTMRDEECNVTQRVFGR